jgi:hypothetical protein
VVTDARLTETGFFLRTGFRLPDAVFMVRDVQGRAGGGR